MIGLRQHTVQVVEHCPDWAELGANACDQIRHACGSLLMDVQHVGSTAVPDLPAKPILDMAAGVRTLEDVPPIVERLTGIGYLYRGDGQDDGGHLFLKESAPGIRTIHLHVVEHNRSQWNHYLFFRDSLRRDAQLRKQYAELKQRLAAEHHNNREAYTAAKHDFIRAVKNDD